MDAPNNPTESASTKVRVLIVFEGAKDRFLLNKCLTEAGFHCHTASNGEEALEILGQREFEPDDLYRFFAAVVPLPLRPVGRKFLRVGDAGHATNLIELASLKATPCST